MKVLRVLTVIALGLAVILSYFPMPVSAGTVLPGTIRVGLFFNDNAHQGASQVTLSGSGGVEIGQRSGNGFSVLKTALPGELVRVTIVGGHVQAETTNWTISLPGDILAARPVGQSQGVKVTEKGRSYRGIVEVCLTGGRLRVVNEVNVEDYLYGVVPKEMSDSWPKEALKAQAVAARTYVAANAGRYGSLGFDLTDDQYSQVYGGVEAEGDNSRSAVNETKGQILVYNGLPITAFYHSNSGGYTENSEKVWVSALPYLRGVPDPYSLGVGSSKDSWQVTYSKGSLENWINSTFAGNGRKPIGSLTGISVLETGVSGRLTKVRVEGTEGSATIENDLIRYYLGNLDSTLFQISTDSDLVSVNQAGSLVQSRGLAGKYVVRGDGEVSQIQGGTKSVAGSGGSRQVNAEPSNYVFDGKGWGHGVGMSQWGAYGMAKAGKGYRDILVYYYQGSTITP